MNLQPCVCAAQHNQATILLVEDEPFDREATQCILESAGFEVLSAENARAALQVFEEYQPSIDLVMTDMVLPGRTGEQLAQDLRQRSLDVRVLVTSGYGNAGDAIEDSESWTYFLAKPYSRRELVEKVEEILAGRPLQRAATQAG